MKATIQAVYNGSTTNSFKGKDGSTVTFNETSLLDGEGGADILNCTALKTLDFSKLKRFGKYNFILELTEKKRPKIVDVLPVQ